jgi:hypothetical protein
MSAFTDAQLTYLTEGRRLGRLARWAGTALRTSSRSG